MVRDSVDFREHTHTHTQTENRQNKTEITKNISKGSDTVVNLDCDLVTRRRAGSTRRLEQAQWPAGPAGPGASAGPRDGEAGVRTHENQLAQ